MRPRTCRNCGDVIAFWQRIRLCPLCRRTYGKGALIGGLIAGAALKLAEWFFA